MRLSTATATATTTTRHAATLVLGLRPPALVQAATTATCLSTAAAAAGAAIITVSSVCRAVLARRNCHSLRSLQPRRPLPIVLALLLCAPHVPKPGRRRFLHSTLPSPTGGWVVVNNAVSTPPARRSMPPVSQNLPARLRRGTDAKNVDQLVLPNVIKLTALATALKLPTDQVVRTARQMGMEVTPDHLLTQKEAADLALEFNVEPIFVENRPEFDLYPRPLPEDPSSLPVRPPVVTIMGHVDHGKTTLLDALRSSNIVEQEAGRITQHIGAFSVTLPSKRKPITFLDTPGHAAFSAMRKRGANVTDIVILVVAADDGVMPQTREAIRYAHDARVPIIVAVNKCDKYVRSLDTLCNDLVTCGVHLEDIGGDVPLVQISALNKTGLDLLEENILAVAEVTDIRAEVDGPVEGYVIESQQSKGLGPVATVLVKRGTLKIGDSVVAGRSWGRVRVMMNDLGKSVKTASPSMPVKVSGWKSLPEAGDKVLQAESVDQASRVSKARGDFHIRCTAASSDAVAAVNSERLEHSHDHANVAFMTRKYKKAVSEFYRGARSLHPSLPNGYIITGGLVRKNYAVCEWEQKENKKAEKSEDVDRVVKLLIKADVAGSAEAIVDSLRVMPQHIVKLQILYSDVGPVTDGDVEQASVGEEKVTIIAFNAPPSKEVQKKATQMGVTVKLYDVIYRLLEDVQELMEEKLPPKVSWAVLGEAEVLQRFDINARKGPGTPVAGSKVLNGVIKTGGTARVLRNKEIVWEGLITSIYHHKDQVSEIKKGQDCGISFEGGGIFDVRDTIVCVQRIEEKRGLYEPLEA